MGLTETLYLYCEPLGIRVMALVPDMTKTNFHKSNRITKLDDEKLMKLIPIAEAQSAKDVADVLFEGIEKDLFIACNVPDFEQQLIAKAKDRNQPDYRVSR